LGENKKKKKETSRNGLSKRRQDDGTGDGTLHTCVNGRRRTWRSAEH